MTDAITYRAPPKAIAKGASKPHGPGWTFLDVLPEIRNMIYKCIYLKDEPVAIVDAREYTRPPTWEDERQNWYDEEWEEVFGPVVRTLAVHDCQFTVTLLRTCRQMYDEASSIFFGANNFVLEVSPHRHNALFRQVRTAVLWLENLGSQYDMLQNVFIDTGRRCTEDRDFAFSDFEITPLVKVLWARFGSHVRITFADTGHSLDARVDPDQS